VLNMDHLGVLHRHVRFIRWRDPAHHEGHPVVELPNYTPRAPMHDQPIESMHALDTRACGQHHA
jgi:hypothetical protein